MPKNPLEDKDNARLRKLARDFLGAEAPAWQVHNLGLLLIIESAKARQDALYWAASLPTFNPSAKVRC